MRREEYIFDDDSNLSKGDLAMSQTYGGWVDIAQCSTITCDR